MLLVEKLPEATLALYRRLRDDAFLDRFVLAGGTAIALHHGHRISDDLDFFLRDSSSLSAVDVAAFIGRLRRHGCEVASTLSPFTVGKFENEGVDLYEHQRNFSIDGVKLTLATLDDAPRARVDRSATIQDGHVHVLSSETLFEAKSRLLVRRATSRDRYDIWFYLDRLGKTMDEVFAFVQDENAYYTDALMRTRLLGATDPSDPLFSPLLADAPSTPADLRMRLQVFVDDFERRAATRLAQQDPSLSRGLR